MRGGGARESRGQEGQSGAVLNGLGAPNSLLTQKRLKGGGGTGAKAAQSGLGINGMATTANAYTRDVLQKKRNKINPYWLTGDVKPLQQH